MFVLSKDGKKLINCNNVASIYIQETGSRYATIPDVRWEIRAMYSAMSIEDVLYDILGTYHTEQECKNAFDKLCDKISKGREHEIINMEDLWDDYY